MKLKKYGPTEERAASIAAPIAAQFGCSVWDVRFEKEGTSQYLRVFIDSPNGITIDDCEKVTRPLDKLLDESFGDVPWDFFEVCSPGLDRELNRTEHLKAFIGKRIFVKTIRPINDKREFSGCLADFDKDTLTLQCENECISIGFAEAAKIKSEDILTQIKEIES